MPLPCTASKSSASGIFVSFPSCSIPSRTTAFARGWSLSSSTAIAISNSSFLSMLPKLSTSVSFGFPSVSVPVLSKANAVSTPKSSNGRPPFIETPPRAALATPLNTADGVEMASAHGLAATNTAKERYRLSLHGSSMTKKAKFSATTSIMTAGT